MEPTHTGEGSFWFLVADTETQPTPIFDEAPPRVWPDRVAQRYVLGAPLAAGGFGTVFRGLDERTGQAVAIKLLPSLGSAQWRAVRREVVALRRARLPGLVRLLDEGVEGVHGFLVMDHVEGSRFPGHTSRDWALLRPCLLSLLEALARLHAAGLIHRDLKPANVLVDTHGHPIVVDLGLATAIDRIPETSGGTAAYAAPEQFWPREPQSASTDLYAVGLMVYEVLSGTLPHGAHGARHTGNWQEVGCRRLLEPAIPLHALAPHVPLAVAQVIDRMLCREPQNRYPSAVAVITALGGEPERIHPRLDHLPSESTAEALEALFHGPEAFLHLPSDAARELWARTAGRAEAVRMELGAWIRSGLAYLEGAQVRMGREAIEQLADGLCVDPAPPRAVRLSAAAQRALARLRVVWPDTHPTLVNIELEAQKELEDQHLVWPLPDGRLGLRPTLDHGLSREEERALHRLLADRLTDPAARIRHLVAADADVATLMPTLEALVSSGDTRQAWPAVLSALSLARDRQDATQARLLELLVTLAITREAQEPLEIALFELERSPVEAEALEILVRATQAARGGEAERAELLLARLAPFADEALEQWRGSALVESCHSRPVAQAEGVLESLAGWAGRGTPDRQARYLGWLGNLRYRQARFEEAADLHGAARAGKTSALGRLSSRLNNAMALLDGLRLEVAVAEAQAAQAEAVRLRQADYEAFALYLQRSALFRQGNPCPPDLELVAAAGEVRPLREGLLAFAEAASARVLGDGAAGLALALRADRLFRSLKLKPQALLALALAVSLGAPISAASLAEVRGALPTLPPGLAVQVVGLFGATGIGLGGVRPEWLASRPPSQWPIPLEAISFSEALVWAPPGISGTLP